MHDDLCPCINKGDKRWCECDLIAKVRADERAAIFGRNQEALDEEMVDFIRDRAMAALRAKVEALPTVPSLYDGIPILPDPATIAGVLALLDGVSE